MTAANFAAAFIALYVGHMVGDHIVQTDHQAVHKGEPGAAGYRALASHVAGYGLAQALALIAVALATQTHGLTGWPAVAGLTFSVVTHGFIDRRWPVVWLMRRTGSEPYSRTPEGRYQVDQTLHIGCLFISSLLVVTL